MINDPLKIIYGGFFAKYRGHTKETVEEVLQYLEKKGIQKIDTAEIYYESEQFLGMTGAATRFKIDTKFSGGLSNLEPTEENVVKSGENSLINLRTGSVWPYLSKC